MAITDGTQFGRCGYFRFWCQKVLPAVYDDSLSYYELLCKVMKWLEDLTEVTNTQSDAIKELQELVQSFLEGEIDPYIYEKIDEWFQNNEPAIIARLDAIEADDWVTTDRIADEAVTEDKIQKGELVIFGDSWGAFGDGFEDWGTPLADMLHCNMHTFAVGGATFVNNLSNLIGTQMITALNTLTADEIANTKYVVVMGGVNDHQPNTPANYVEQVVNFLDSVSSTFPNAMVQFFQTSCAPTYAYETKWTNCIRAFWKVQYWCACTSNTSWAKGRRICFNPQGAAFYFNSMAPIASFYRSDGLHPNAYGRNAILNSLLQGFGIGNINPGFSIKSTVGDRIITWDMKPNDIDFAGSIPVGFSGTVSLNRSQSERLAAALAGKYTENVLILKKAFDGSNRDLGYIGFGMPNLFNSTNIVTLDLSHVDVSSYVAYF